MLNSECRFKVVEEEFGTNLSYTLLDSKTGEFVSILPFLGGAINRMTLRHEDELIEILDSYTSEEDIKENLNTSFKGSNLFPFPNRIKDGKYSLGKENFELDMNFPQESNAIHGLVFEEDFKVVDKEDGEIGCILILEFESKPATGYPFQYRFKSIYRLKEGEGFECKVKVSNIMDRSIPLGHGWHPYFLVAAEIVNEVAIEFPSTALLEVDEQNIPTGKKREYTVFNTLKPINETILDNCFEVKGDKRDIAETTLFNHEKGFGYTIWQETGKYKYNYLQIYTPPHRKSIAIEPMTCAPNAFNNEQGLIILGPFESVNTSFGIKHMSE